MKRDTLKSLFAALMLPALFACSSIDCPLNNRVYTKYMLGGDGAPLLTTLTVATTRMDGEDTVLLNSVTAIDSFMLPMSYTNDADTLFFGQVVTDDYVVVDTVYINKDNQPHFESIDCTPSFFHTIQSIEHTTHGIDSIMINNANVTYDANKPHINIYFKVLAY